MSAAEKQTHQFQADASQLLNLVTHALYSDREVFIRELISNASDALDKLRFNAVSDNTLYENDSDLKIFVDFDVDNKTLTFSDNGIGMSAEDIADHLGTIAKSGTKEFLGALTGDQKKDSQLIGQFGVGFYSAFIVSDKVTVNSRRAGLSASEGVCWESTGDGSYTTVPIEKASRGTQIILHLKEDAAEFLNGFRLRQSIKTYSDHISFPIFMKKEPDPVSADDKDKTDKDEIVVEEDEIVNRATALWTRGKRDISDEEYNEFYKHISHDFDDALAWSHNQVEGKTEYASLLYIPKRAPFDLWNREQQFGVKLYVKRVFIMDDAEQFMPKYLRFVRGIIDSNDLPLNISREILQKNRVVETIKAGSVKKILGLLDKMAKKEPEKYAEFWAQFGEVLKEGPAEDMANKDAIAKLLRFATTHVDSDKQTVSLDDYIGRMVEGQDKIYYITAENYAGAKSSPHLELFKKKGIEVLLLTNRVDDWLMTHMSEYKGKELKSIAKGAVDLGDLEDEQVKKDNEQINKTYDDLIKRLKDKLKDDVKDIRMTNRLTNSPACIVADEQDIGLQMQRILKSAGQNFPSSKPILELNPEHAVVKRLQSETDDTRLSDWGHLLLDQAILADGGQLDNPAQFVGRLNQLFLQVGGGTA